MNPHSFTENLKTYLQAAFSELHVYTPVTSEERCLPYALLTLSSSEERIPRNNTWFCELEMQLQTSAHDLAGSTARQFFTELCRKLEEDTLRKDLNNSAPDYLIYRILLLSVDDALVQDDIFIQPARFRVILQF